MLADSGRRSSRDALERSGVGASVSRQLAQGLAIRGRADHLKQSLDSVVSLPSLGKAEVIDFFADRQEAQPGVLADQTQANPGIGPAAADGLGDAAVVGGQTPRGPAIAHEFIKALPGA